MTKYLTLFEGECETSIIEWLKLKGYRFGRTIKKVLSDVKKIERSLNMIDNKTVVTVVLDTDTLFGNLSKIERMKSNILYLLRNAKRVRIITQNKNLEDELQKSLHLRSKQKLFEHFNSNNCRSYKKALAALIPEKLEIKLSNLDFDLFWNSKVMHQFYNENKLIIINCTLKDIK